MIYVNAATVMKRCLLARRHRAVAVLVLTSLAAWVPKSGAFEATAVVKGRVIDQLDRPLAARVTIYAEPASTGAIPAPVVVETDVAGRFSAKGVSHIVAVIRVTVGDVAVEKPPFRVETATNDIGEIVVDVGRAIRGSVYTALTDTPVKDATVIATQHLSQGGREHEVHSLSDGRFVLPNLAEVQYDLDIVASGLERSRVTMIADGDVGTIKLASEARLKGALFGPDGKPVVDDATVRAVLKANGDRWEQSADVRGHFVLNHLSAGTYTISVDASEWQPLALSAVSVLAGQTVDLGALRLKQGTTIIGLVHDVNGAPIAGAKALAQFDEGEKRNLRTGSAGTFRLAGIPAGHVRILVQHQQHSTATRELSIVEGQKEVSVDIEMGTGGRVNGTLRSASGAPLPGATLLLVPAGQTGTILAARLTTVGTDGAFEFDNVTPGEARIEADIDSPGGGLLKALQRAVTVREGETTSIALVVRTVAVRSRVIQNGVPLAGAVVVMRSAADRSVWRSGPTDTDGTSLTTVASEGLLNISVLRPDGTIAIPHNPQVAIASSDTSLAIDIDLSDSLSLKGIVYDSATSEPISGATVSIRLPEIDQAVAVASKSDGGFDIVVPPARQATIRVSAPLYSPYTGTFDPSAEQFLEIVLTKGLSIAGRVVGQDGAPASDVVVSATELESGALAGIAISAADGSFVFTGLRSSIYTLFGENSTSGAGWASDVETGLSDTVLTLRPGGTIRLRLVGNDGVPVVGRPVTVSAIDGAKVATGSFAYSDSSGHVSIDVPAGHVQLRIIGGTTHATEVDATVEPSTTQDIVVRIK